jgi:hypothetical protein
MSGPLETYLQDHLAGASHAIDLLHWMKGNHSGDALGAFLTDLVTEIEKDRDVLAKIAERAVARESAMKETGAWLSEKINRMKLSDHGATGIGTFEALEFLVLGIHGKSALWRALAVIARKDGRFADFDFENLADRAKSQEAAVDALRLKIAPAALGVAEKLP